MYRVNRLAQLFPSDLRTVLYTDTWMRDWAKRERMAPRTLYRVQKDAEANGFITIMKARVPGPDGKVRLRKVWVFHPLHAIRELALPRIRVLEERLKTNGGRLTLKEAEEELDRVRDYLLELVDGLSEPGLADMEADLMYDPGTRFLWQWVGMIFLGLRKHRGSGASP